MLKVNWNRSQVELDFNPLLRGFARWLREHGYRDEYINSYQKSIKLYLENVKRVTYSRRSEKLPLCYD